MKKRDLLNGPSGLLITVPIDGIEGPRLRLTRDELTELILDTVPPTQIRKISKIVQRERLMTARSQAWEKSVRETLGREVGILTDTTGKVTLDLPCEGGHCVKWSSPNKLPPAAIASKLKRLGWRIGQHTFCPEHNGRKANDSQKEDNMTDQATMTPEQKASDAARTAKRLAVLALDESFNVERGQFKPGVSDASIAKELGIAEVVVQRVRDEMFGPLKEPAEIDDLRLQLIKLQGDLGAIEIKFIGEVEATQTKIGNLLGRLDGLVAKNGWKG